MTDAGDFLQCADCGKYNRAGRTTCWLCEAPLGAEAAAPQAASRDVHPQHSRDEFFIGIFGSVILVLLVIALVLNGAWGIAVMLLLVVVPIGAIVLSKVRRGGAEGTGGKITSVLVSLASVVLAFSAAAVAFVTTCFAGFFGGAALSDALGVRGEQQIGWGLGTGLILATIVALTVAVLLIRFFWRRGGVS